MTKRWVLKIMFQETSSWILSISRSQENFDVTTLVNLFSRGITNVSFSIWQSTLFFERFLYFSNLTLLPNDLIFPSAKKEINKKKKKERENNISNKIKINLVGRKKERETRKRMKERKEGERDIEREREGETLPYLRKQRDGFTSGRHSSYNGGFLQVV